MKTASGAEPVTHRKRMLYSPTAFGLSWSMSARLVISTSPTLIDLPPARKWNVPPCGAPQPERAILRLAEGVVQSQRLCTECRDVAGRWYSRRLRETRRLIL